jgi:hypothetical protein
MAISVLQTVIGTDSAASGTTAVVTITAAAGSYLDLFICCADAQTITTPVSSPVLTWTKQNALDDAGNAERLEQWTSSVTSAGSITITETYSAASTFRGIAVKEIGGSTGYDSVAAAKAAQVQPTPATTPDAVTSGNTPALTSQPALASGWSMCTNGGTNPATGTGFTSDTNGIQIGTAFNLVRGENKRVTVTTALAATFTTGFAIAFGSMVVVFLESIAGGPAVSPMPFYQTVLIEE